MAHLQVSASAIARELCTPESPPSYSNFRTAAAASTTARQRSQGHRTPSVSTLMCTHTEARTLMCTHVCDWCALGLWRHSVCGASVARTRPAPNDRQHCGRRQDWARALPWGQACQRSLYCIKVRARSSPVHREGRQSNLKSPFVACGGGKRACAHVPLRSETCGACLGVTAQASPVREEGLRFANRNFTDIRWLGL